MKKLILTLLIACITIINLSGQTIVIEDKNELISDAAYSKKISEDFSYLLLGNNSPQQGVSATLNDDGSTIKLNGLLYSGSTGVLTLEADLSASNGVYFFDEENGSERAKISFNYYRKIYTNSYYYSLSDLKKKKLKLSILDTIIKTYSKYKILKDIIKNNKIIEDSILNKIDEIVKPKVKYLIEKYINSEKEDIYIDLLPTYDIKTAIYDSKENLLKVIFSSSENETIHNNLKIAKLLKDFDQVQQVILKTLEKDINKLEIEETKQQWTQQHLLFFGATPFYQRESFKRFAFDSTQTFRDMFSSEKGDIYGITLSLNYNFEKGAGLQNKLIPERVFIRLSTTAQRTSNISAFRNSSLDLTTPVGNDSNGNPIIFTNSDAAFIGDTSYEYGTGNSFSFELYYYPFKLPVGIFGRIGYEYINFSRFTNIKDKEISPLRLGLLFSLKNKEKDKPLITVQTFMDRTDLSLSPNGNDNDLRFGLGIGLPINIR